MDHIGRGVGVSVTPLLQQRCPRSGLAIRSLNGLVVPILVVYLIWMRRNELREATKTTWTAGLAIAAAGKLPSAYWRR